MTDQEVLAELEAGGEAMEVPLSGLQLDRLLAYLKLIERWGAVYNLTAVRDRRGIVRQHLLDSLALVPPLRRHATAIEAPLRILDVGSGAGLPGLVIAIAQPGWPVSCVDTVGKKAGFMRQVIAELQLTGATAIHGRVESLPAKAWNVVTSRAFASLQDFVASSRHCLEPGGCWVAMKAKGIDDEQAQLSETVVFHVEPLTVPGLDAARSLVWMKPTDAS